jgi:hypothetical protein
VHCTEPLRETRLSRIARFARWTGLAGAGALSVLAGCSTTTPKESETASAPPSAARSAPFTVNSTPSTLPPPGVVRNWNEVRLQAARRMVSANPTTTYMSEPPEPLLAIPVMEVELNADGSIKRIEVMRRPSQALDTVKLAAEAIERAAPFGDVSRLPKPWRFTETFLFNDDRKFKPRTLDQ